MFRIFENRFFVLFNTGMANFICVVCVKERLISTEYNMKAKRINVQHVSIVGQRKSFRIYINS